MTAKKVLQNCDAEDLLSNFLVSFGDQSLIVFPVLPKSEFDLKKTNLTSLTFKKTQGYKTFCAVIDALEKKEVASTAVT